VNASSKGRFSASTEKSAETATSRACSPPEESELRPELLYCRVSRGTPDAACLARASLWVSLVTSTPRARRLGVVSPPDPDFARTAPSRSAASAAHDVGLDGTVTMARITRHTHLLRQCLQLGDAIFDVRVRREKIVDATAVERVDDKHVRGRRNGFSLRILDTAGEPVDLAQGGRQPQRIAADYRAETIRLIFA